ncbi:hypothetical protein CHH83_19690 [Bacillus sp. 7586-K]|nr:hypothetical protein CHH83_19690 [Bacillus sp. 7586-K]
MLQGICIDTENTVVLTEGEQYYLFPNGTEHYYVSKFPNEGAHTGCFQAKYFKVIEKEDVAMSELDREKVYFAHMYRKEGYPGLELIEYYIKPKKTHCNIYCDKALTQFKGCFPLDWFTDFEEIEFRCTENGQLVLF